MAKNILIIPDLHIPFHHPDALRFLEAVKAKYKPRKVVCIGDEVDFHTISFHDKDPDVPFSPSSELESAIEVLKELYKIFPKVQVCESNHSSLVYRKQKHNGLPRSVFKSYNEIFSAPKGWVWKDEIKLDGVVFRHHFSKSLHNSIKYAGANICQGHYHSEFGIAYVTYGEANHWGMSVGCLINRSSLAFRYAKFNLPKAILGCGMIVNGVPQLIPMRLNSSNRWTGSL